MFVLGFGLGSLAFEWREGFVWLWTNYKRINEPWELIMEGLFLLGVILGFFVVRNWSKEQKDFLASLTAALGGAVIATALGPLTKSVDAISSFAFYFLGFTISGALNMIGASWLMANYSNRPSVTNRALLDFLYGADKAEAVDKQFLKNFERDPVYARRLLTEALDTYKEKVRSEFAKKMEAKRRTKSLLTYYQLVSIEGPRGADADSDDDDVQTLDPKGSPASRADEKFYTVNIRRLKDEEKIDANMFRMSISVKNQEYLEYIGSDTGRGKSFPMMGSVAGLALLARQTIVMDRDKNRRFRTTEAPDGICPVNVEQQRGLKEIAYLSFISIPIMTELGNRWETPLGIMSASTRLFALSADQELTGFDNDLNCKIKVRLSALTDLARLIYDQKDECVDYLEEMRTVTVPLLELYLRCRQGAT